MKSKHHLSNFLKESDPIDSLFPPEQPKTTQMPTEISKKYAEMSDDQQIEVIRRNLTQLNYIEHPSCRVQIAAIELGEASLELIKDPCDEAIVKAIIADWTNVRFVKDKKFSNQDITTILTHPDVLKVTNFYDILAGQLCKGNQLLLNKWLRYFDAHHANENINK